MNLETKYKVGDRVRTHDGGIRTILKVQPCYTTALDDMFEYDIAGIVAKFKVGDRVVTLDDFDDVGVIVSVDNTTGNYAIQWRHSDRSTCAAVWIDSEITAAPFTMGDPIWYTGEGDDKKAGIVLEKREHVYYCFIQDEGMCYLVDNKRVTAREVL